MFSKFLKDFLYQIEALNIFKKVSYDLSLNGKIYLSYFWWFNLLYIIFPLGFEETHIIFQPNI